MKEISFFLPIIPYGKGRARTFVRQGITRTITPTKTREHAKQMHFLVSKELSKKGFRQAFEGPIEVDYIFYLPRPKTVKTRIYPTVKPDEDNLAKQCNDVFNELLWRDDTQIVQSNIKKLYAENDAEVGIFVYVKEILSKEENEALTLKQLKNKKDKLA